MDTATGSRQIRRLVIRSPFHYHTTPSPHYCNTPLFHYHVYTISHADTMPREHYSTMQLLHYPVIPLPHFCMETLQHSPVYTEVQKFAYMSIYELLHQSQSSGNFYNLWDKSTTVGRIAQSWCMTQSDRGPYDAKRMLWWRALEWLTGKVELSDTIYFYFSRCFANGRKQMP